ncbi:MAG: hypothetical protein ACRD30_05040 [Bryobacteraceae bacterium]
MNWKTWIAILCCPASLAARTFSITQDRQTVAPGERVVFGTEPPQNGATWSIRGFGIGILSSDSGASVIYTPPNPVPACFQIAVTATVNGESHTAYVVAVAKAPDLPQEVCPGASITRSIIGLEQAGASSAQGSQKLFADLFRSAAIYGQGLRWWSDVRIASFPEQIAAPVSRFNPASLAANLPVNQLAQFGEFRTGIEQRIAQSRAGLPRPGVRQERNTLGFFAGFGAIGALGSPANFAQIFNLPPEGTPQAAAFHSAFPNFQIPSGTQYVAFAPPDHGRAFLEYAAGLRLTTHFIDAAKGTLAQTAMFSVAFGQNELITAGKRQGVVGTFEGFYPLPIPGGFVYLFGRSDVLLGRPSALRASLALSPAAPGVLPSDPNVAIIAWADHRDLYTIGLGIDAGQIIASIAGKSKN